MKQAKNHPSKRTKVVSIRLENETYNKLEHRLKGRRSRHESVAAYLKDRIEYDANRQHKKGK